MAGTLTRRRWDLVIAVTAAPYAADTATTVLRLAQAALEQDRTVRIWACGWFTMLTQRGLGDVKPPNVRDPDGVYPSSAAVIRRMLADFDGRFGWIGCTTCSAERGATDHIPQVVMRTPGRLIETMRSARQSIYIGGM